LAYVREQLIFHAQTHVRDEIANYFPSTEDLDYPAKLEHAAVIGAGNEVMDKYLFPVHVDVYFLSQLIFHFCFSSRMRKCDIT
jgi:hypothetical protein